MWKFNVRLVCPNSPLSKLELIKLVDYLIYNIVDKIFICKIRFEFKNKKKMGVSNHVWCYKNF